MIEAYGRFLERAGRAADAHALYTTSMSPSRRAGADRAARAWRASRPDKKPEPLIRNAEDGAAEALFGIAASLSDQASADVSILYLRMALYLRPDLALAQISAGRPFRDACRNIDDAIAIYRGIDKILALLPHGGDRGGGRRASGWARRTRAIADLKALAAADPNDSETWIALGDAYRDHGQLRRGDRCL